MNRVVSLVEVCVAPVLVLLTCCSSSGDPAAERSESLPLVEAPQPGPCGGPDGEGPAEPFRSCLTDDDCVAVPLVGCCHNGWKTSVRRGAQDAYGQSFVCPTKRPICPLYLVVDERVAACNQSTHLCALTPARQCPTAAPAAPR